MNILIAIPAFVPEYGGPVPVVHALATGLVAQGHQVHIVTSDMAAAGGKRVSQEFHETQAYDLGKERIAFHRYDHHFSYNWASFNFGLTKVLKRMMAD